MNEFVEDTVHELYLTTLNTREVYFRLVEPTIKMLRKKLIKGIYDKDKAVIAWKRVADKSAKMYAKEFCCKESDWNVVFTSEDRLECARRFEKSQFEDVSYGLNTKGE